MHTLAAAFLFIPITCLGDLPIHALVSDVIGDWTFVVSDLKKMPQTCGSSLPNENISNLSSEFRKVQNEILTNSHDRLEVSLTSGRKRGSKGESLGLQAFSNDVEGLWTMVYDLGFEITVGNHSIASILSYDRTTDEKCSIPTNGDGESRTGDTKCYITEPSKTLLTYYTQTENGVTLYGCAVGWKDDSATGASYVVEHDQQKLYPSVEHDGLSTIRKRRNPYTKQHHEYAKVFDDDCDNWLSNEFNVTYVALPEDLPPSFSWTDKLKEMTTIQPAVEQGDCGACYAIASTEVLQERAVIKLADSLGIDLRKTDKLDHPRLELFNERTYLDPQSMLSCSFLNQGCEGGYPAFMGWWMKNIGATSNRCSSYSRSNGQCPIQDITLKTLGSSECESDMRVYASEYGYVGGCYGCTSINAMMKEIYENGPVVVAIDAPLELAQYSGGVFTKTPKSHTRVCFDDPEAPKGWEYTNHALVVVGWGESESPTGEVEPYWIVRNSWGKRWGNGGYGKLARGSNYLGIESQAVWMNPDLTRGRLGVLSARLHEVETHMHA